MMNSTRCPAVSILMPVRNEGRFLTTALRSLQAQTLMEWELVAVNDGSTDDTPLILAEEGLRVSSWVDIDPRKIGRMLHGAPVLATNQIKADGVKLLMTVGARGAREVVRYSSFQAGFREGATAICVA